MTQTETTNDGLRDMFVAALGGDATAYRRFLEQVTVRLRRELKDEDLVQDVLMAIHRKRDLYRPEFPVWPWIRAIAKHRLIDSQRARARRPELVASSQWLDDVEDPRGTLDRDTSDLTAALEQLDERQREILRLAKLEGLAYAEIGRRFGLSVAAVKVSVHRSLKAIRRTR